MLMRNFPVKNIYFVVIAAKQVLCVQFLTSSLPSYLSFQVPQLYMVENSDMYKNQELQPLLNRLINLAYRFVCLPVCLTVCLPACLPACMPNTYLPACLPICLPTGLPFCLPVSLLRLVIHPEKFFWIQMSYKINCKKHLHELRQLFRSYSDLVTEFKCHRNKFQTSKKSLNTMKIRHLCSNVWTAGNSNCTKGKHKFIHFSVEK